MRRRIKVTSHYSLVSYAFVKSPFCVTLLLLISYHNQKGIEDYKLDQLIVKNYFHSHTLDAVFPASSISCSKTLTALLRDDSFSVEEVLKNIESRKLVFPEPINLPIPCALHLMVS